MPAEIFPDISTAIRERGGLVAVGGSLTVPRLLAAYRQGIFPWYGENTPLLWWASDPRMVLLPENLHISRSLGKTLKKDRAKITTNHAFTQVIHACANAPRPAQSGTWIRPDIQRAYLALHHAGHAHSFEYWAENASGSPTLYGGFYGVQIGQVFFGESMFARRPDASKITFARAVLFLHAKGIRLIDCQMHSAHLARFGAKEIPFSVFRAALDQYCPHPLHWEKETVFPAPAA